MNPAQTSGAERSAMHQPISIARRIGHDALTHQVGYTSSRLHIMSATHHVGLEAASPVMKWATLPSPCQIRPANATAPPEGRRCHRKNEQSAIDFDGMVGATAIGVLNIAVAIHPSALRRFTFSIELAGSPPGFCPFLLEFDLAGREIKSQRMVPGLSAKTSPVRPAPATAGAPQTHAAV
jgi:hypothetical protein